MATFTVPVASSHIVIPMWSTVLRDDKLNENNQSISNGSVRIALQIKSEGSCVDGCYCADERNTCLYGVDKWLHKKKKILVEGTYKDMHMYTSTPSDYMFSY